MTDSRRRPAKRPRRPDDEPSLIEQVEVTPAGAQEMAAARLAVSIESMLDRTMRASGMSQADLAQVLGLTEGRVSQIMNSDGNLRVGTIGRVFRALGFNARLELDPVMPAGRTGTDRTDADRSDGWRDLKIGALLYRMEREIAGSGAVPRSTTNAHASAVRGVSPSRPPTTGVDDASWKQVGSTRKTVYP
jgi:transcriptional regulator with XRE-family HTH domain